MHHTEPDLIDVPPEMKERLVQFREAHHGEPLGPVANTVIFEDEKLRVWEMVLEPGGHSALHHHEHDYYLAIFSGDRIAGILSKESGQDPFPCVLPEDGNFVPIPKGGTEWAFNVGTQTYREILIELKES
jgi:hypothetical protein